jgi:hypothetical protein
MLTGVLGLQQDCCVLQLSGPGVTLSILQVGTRGLRRVGSLRQPQCLGPRAQGPSFSLFGASLPFQCRTVK